MIRIEELMLGNWLNFTYPTPLATPFPKQVDRHNLLDISLGDGNDSCFSPITITPEILGKAGFVYTIDKWILRNGTHYDVMLEYAGNHCQIYQNGLIGKPFKYVHELQNWIFLYTGKPLTINL